MAKGARSKYKKRLRSAKGAHLYLIKGKAQLERLNARISDPSYQMESEYSLPPNAFLEPNNPLAVFPQVMKPDILDFRSNKIATGSQAAIGVFRKHLSKNPNVKHSKYEAKVKTAEMLAAEPVVEMEDETPVAVKSTKTTKETMDELAAMTEKL